MYGRLTRFAALAIFTIALAPTVASAQWWSSRARSDSTDSCGQSGCVWLTLVNDLPFGSLGLSRSHRGVLGPGAPGPFGFSNVVFSMGGPMVWSLSDCPACKSNDRPFIVPPGIEKKLANQHGATSGSASDADHAGEIGDEENGPPVQTPARAGGGVGAHNGARGAGVGAAVTSAVVVTPEPAALLLVATGLIALAPVVVRAGRRAD